MNGTPNFDRVARVYRWCEYLALGWALERTRNRFLAQIGDARSVLVLGDGDGRFTAAMLAAHPQLHVVAVDASERMLALLQKRCATFGSLLTLVHADARLYEPTQSFDLIVTHFFLDCLTQAEILALSKRLASSAGTGSRWLVSEFSIPTGFWHWPARMYVRGLYLAFRILTGLKVDRLPDFASALNTAGFSRCHRVDSLGGLLTAQLWSRDSAK